MLHAREKERKLPEGYALPLLPLRHSPAGKEPSQQQALYSEETTTKAKEKKAARITYRGMLLSGRAAVRPACSRVHPRKVSLSLAFSHCLCPSLSLFLSLLLSSSYRARHLARLAVWLTGLTDRIAADCSYWLASWLTRITGDRQTCGVLPFLTRLLLAETPLAVLVAPAAPRLAPSRSLARTYAR